MAQRRRGDSGQDFGDVQPGYEPAAETLRHQFAEGLEVGAIVPGAASTVGARHVRAGVPHDLGHASMALAVVHSHDLLDFEAPAAAYWLEFAHNGKAELNTLQSIAATGSAAGHWLVRG